MKTKFMLLVLLLTSFMAQAKNYSCTARNYHIYLDPHQERSTYIRLKTINSHDTIFNAYAAAIDKDSKVTSFEFYGTTEPIIARFRNSDLESLPAKFTAHIKGLFSMSR